MKGLFLEDLSVGQSAELTMTVSEQGIESFAQVTGDVNPVHLDEAYAATTPFKTRIAHGTITEIDQEKARITLETVCTVADKPVVEGEATIMVPRREG